MQKLSTRPWALILVGIASFHLAYEIPILAPAIIGYLAALALLTRVETARRAFGYGLVLAYGVLVPQLWFFAGLFKTGAVTLWTVLAVWIAAFVVLGHLVCKRWPRWGIWLLPLLWTGLEYARSELYYLRFAWLTPGLALEDPSWHGLLTVGQYGVGLAAMVLAILFLRRPRVAVVITAALALVVSLQPLAPTEGRALSIVGVQMEFPDESMAVKALDRAVRRAPHAELVVLPEYTLQGEVPDAMRDWCRRHGKHLIVGGKAYTDSSRNQFDNTAFVVDPNGDIVFSQVKAVPIQFFADGRPATSQRVWESPWGKIGIAICYDFSFSRVIDPLVEQGAQLLVIPTMDVIDWGQRQHELHSRLGPIRAREYGLPVVRAASSGVSQLIRGDGTVIASVPVGEELVPFWGTVHLPASANPPIDRKLAPLCAFVTMSLTGYLFVLAVVASIQGRRYRAAAPGVGSAQAAA
jgi:apolipoprotein N-acyltransferase